jgi:uncharacterized protein CbrC (UPF0167 family)
MYNFKYFADYQRWASFTTQPHTCPNSEALDGVFFDDSNVPDIVCLADLVAGKTRVYIPEYLIEELKKSIHQTYPNSSDEVIENMVNTKVDELSRTPPVPWIQNNNWPIRNGDFCRYIGEWKQEDLCSQAADGDGFTYLFSILEHADDYKEREGLWDAIKTDWTSIFVFEDLANGGRVAIEQSY